MGRRTSTMRVDLAAFAAVVVVAAATAAASAASALASASAAAGYTGIDKYKFDSLPDGAYFNAAGEYRVRFTPSNKTIATRACQKGSVSMKYPFCDTSLSFEDRVANLVSLIKPEEKGPLLTARGWPQGNLANISDIGVPAYDYGCNCVHGVQSTCGTRCPTSFPSPNALGASFNSTVVRAMGAIMGVELRALWLEGVTEPSTWSGQPHIGLDCWSPNININRDPRWGRNQEVASEDPYWNGLYGKEYSIGLQEGEDKRYYMGITTLKHWDAYSLESFDGVTRHDFNAIVSDQMFADTYFPAFKQAVMEGKAASVMCSYNAVNGVPTCANPMLKHVLRDEWGFDGYITSDTGAVQDIYDQHHYVKTPEEAACVAITNGSCDLNSGEVYYQSLLSGVESGLCDMSAVDTALKNTMMSRFKLGLFDPIETQKYWHVPPTAVRTEAALQLSLDSTRQSMVLLKNDANVLPMKKGVKIAVIGPRANATGDLLGNYLGQICPGGVYDYSCVESPFDAIKAANVGGTTQYTHGCHTNTNDTSDFENAIAMAKDADYVVLGMGIDQSIEGEGMDRTSIDLPYIQHMLIANITALGKPTAMFLINGGMVAIEEEKNTPGLAILEAFYPGFFGAQAITEVLFGDYNPGGKLPITVYHKDYVNEVDMYNMDFAKPPGRSYRFYTGEPLYPFGYGISYTTFSVKWSNDASRNPTTLPTVASESDSTSTTYSVTVTNTGAVAGDEVVQAFYKPKSVDLDNDLPTIKQLFGFQRVHLQPGQSTTIDFTLPVTTLRVADIDGNLVSASGTFEIEFTNGVAESVTSMLTLTGDNHIITPFPGKGY